MENVLFKELLYKQEMVVVYKTYDSDNQLYGLYMPSEDCGKCLDATYTQIFPFAKNGQAAAITENGEYVWVGLDFNESKMKEGEQLVWSTFYASITNSAEVGTQKTEVFMGYDDYTSNTKKIN
ncbi:hypothetical protein [Rufibacter hautae]|uniref:Uncharacterized protein n=1 Tax=Rufibacter hautae TaxID=2595005 RepID=A0A5B6T9Y1_9BACT|nr:hypothetical protein [Rufibacter hautae]KAA3436745.1 hypothetical protein FOA19_20415 [Rufibacter hautae]